MSKNGRKFFHFRYSYRKRKKALSIGEFPAVSVQEPGRRLWSSKPFIQRHRPPDREKEPADCPHLFRVHGEGISALCNPEQEELERRSEQAQGRWLPVFGEMILSDIDQRYPEVYREDYGKDIREHGQQTLFPVVPNFEIWQCSGSSSRRTPARRSEKAEGIRW